MASEGRKRVRNVSQMVQMGWPESLDRPSPRHGTHGGLRWGWTAGRGLAEIGTAGDHRTGAGDTYLQGMHHPLRHLPAQVIEALDWRDARWSHLLQHVRQPTYGPQIARDVHARSRAVSPWPQDVMRG